MDSRKTYFANLNIPDNKRIKIDMDYKEKYEKAYKLYHSEKTTKDQKYVLERLFPELKESEDERIRKRIIHALHGDVLEMSEIKEAVDWLEKQGEQNPAEWSKEDEELFNDVSDTYFYNDSDYPEEDYKRMLKKVLDWMNKRAKFLRPQNKWKPSEKQLVCLSSHIAHREGDESSYSLNVLRDLLEQLKKLREE